jgi:hypothetical protein
VFRLRRLAAGRYRRTRSAEAIFSRVYSKNQWGGEAGEFFSGPGSNDVYIVASYTTLVSNLLMEEPGLHVVDLGCGDFKFASKFVESCGSYTGVDVVSKLALYNAGRYGTDRISFQACDITRGQIATRRRVFNT